MIDIGCFYAHLTYRVTEKYLNLKTITIYFY